MKVFWSWQSDKPGKTNRHFIRDSIQDAIDALKQSGEVLEPSEREAADGIHLDHDRKGVAGSPDLARTIFQKIATARVFIADVSPVSSLRRQDESGKRATKKSMNANVAIELGYALHALGDESLLMVMNTAYGKRSDLPFDLSHKAGPITYNLQEDADSDTIRMERAKLAGALQLALRPYLSPVIRPQAPTFSERTSKPDSGLYYSRGDLLGIIEDAEDQKLPLYLPVEPLFYLRAIPRKASQPSMLKADLLKLAADSQVGPFSRQPGGYVRPNMYGAIALDLNSRGDAVRAVTQFFDNGELWGVSLEWFKERDGKGYIPTGALQESLNISLANYLRFLKSAMKAPLPYDIEFGGYGLTPFSLVVTDPYGTQYWDLLEPAFKVRRQAPETSPKVVSELVGIFMDTMFDLTGYKRPKPQP